MLAHCTASLSLNKKAKQAHPMLTDDELAHYNSEGYVVRRQAFDCRSLVERLAPVVDDRPRQTVHHLYEVLVAQRQPDPLLALAEFLCGTVAAGGRRVCGTERRLRHSMLSLLGDAPEGTSYRQQWHKVCLHLSPSSW